MAKFPKEFRWNQERTLGEGRQGLVSVVTDGSGELPGEFALKRLRSDASADSYERFSREIDVLQTVDHPAIVKVVDHSSAGDAFQYYVMELVPDAVPLKKLFGSNENPFFGSGLQTLSFVEQLLSALQQCEEKKVVHRDMSPSNVLIGRDGKVHLIDFGLCVVEGGMDGHSLTGEAGAGTQNYMAPECEAGALGDATTKSDLYSVGKLAWSAVSGRSAFSRESPAFTSHAMNEVFPDGLATWHLHGVFEKSIRRNPDDRWASCQQALNEVRRLRWVVESGYPPLEKASEFCPRCGSESVSHNSDGWQIFHNPIPSGYSAKTCTKCGFTFVQSYSMAQKEAERRALLD